MIQSHLPFAMSVQAFTCLKNLGRQRLSHFRQQQAQLSGFIHGFLSLVRTTASGRSRPFESAYQVAELGKSRTVTTDRSRPDADIRRDDRSLTSRTRHLPMAKLQQAKLRYEFGLVLGKNVDAGTEERVPASDGRTNGAYARAQSNCSRQPKESLQTAWMRFS